MKIKEILKRIQFKNNSKKFCFNINTYTDLDKKNNNSNHCLFEKFNPKNELNKFYVKYIDNFDRKYLDSSIENKTEQINKISSFSLKEKFSGFLEYKKQMNSVLDIIFKDICKKKDVKLLQEINEYYFKMEKKMIRPHFIIQLSKLIDENLNNKKEKDYLESEFFKSKILPYTACIESLHNASLLQDDIIDKSSLRRSKQTAHDIYGVKDTIFSSNYILSRSASIISDIDEINLNIIYSNIVFDLTYGEIQQSINKPFVYESSFDAINNNLERYMKKTYYKTASLIALSFRGLAVLFKLNENIQELLYNLGLHLGILFQIIDDVIDVQCSSQILKKPAFSDLKDCIINSHIIYEMNNTNIDNKILFDMIKRKFKLEGDLERVKKLLDDGLGVLKSRNLALDHLIECLKILENDFFKKSNTKDQLIKSIIFMFNRNF